MHYLKQLVNRVKIGEKAGIYSACTSDRLALEAVAESAVQTGGFALIEATANQVDQFGGYTGMTPPDFVDYAKSIADNAGLPHDRLILGGDHLGPLVWQNESEQKAMDKAEALVRAYTVAGFTKLHIDTSMFLADDDKKQRLPDRIIAARAARLIYAAEEEYAKLKLMDAKAVHPVYIIGSEVPVPGGAHAAETVTVTDASDFRSTMKAFTAALALVKGDPMQYVIGIVVQPGVEFGDQSITRYDRKKASKLMEALKSYDLVFEGHSTDYQSRFALREMVQDGVAILKVGPALTFACREGLFALEMMEKEFIAQNERSNFRETLEKTMLLKPENWQKHYHGNENELAIKRAFSYADRSRYYMNTPDVAAAREKLFENMKNIEIPLSLLSQYMPVQYEKICSGTLRSEPEALVKSRVKDCIDTYLFAIGS